MPIVLSSAALEYEVYERGCSVPSKSPWFLAQCLVHIYQEK